MELSKIETELTLYCKEIQALLASGKSLREISRWSFEQRESGRNVPYLAIGDTAQKRVISLVASASSKQKELKAFFSEQAEGSVLSKYELWVTEESGVLFTKRHGKGRFFKTILN